MSAPALFDPQLWTPPRALAFARGLYHVAASDGITADERALLGHFLEAAGAPADVDAVIATPFDFAEARRELDSHWIRRLMVRACRVLAEIDGGPTDEERDALRAMALGLGVGERLALAPAERILARPAEIVPWIANQPVDWVSWDDEAQAATFWSFPAGTAPLAYGAKLMVARGQALAVFREPSSFDLLRDGVHEATPEALPVLAESAGWQAGPVAARLTFISLGPTEMLRWGSVDPINVPGATPGAEPVPLRAFGRFSVRIGDASRAFQRFCRTGFLPTDEFETRVRRMAAGRFGEALRELAQSEGWSAERLLQESGSVIDRARPTIERAFSEAGLLVRRFEMESLTGPLALELRTTGGSRVLSGGGFANQTHGQSGAVTPEAALSCHRCLNALPPNARFCAQCGAPQRKACATCGTDVSVRAKFCPQCGSAQAGTGPN